MPSSHGVGTQCSTVALLEYGMYGITSGLVHDQPGPAPEFAPYVKENCEAKLVALVMRDDFF